MAKKLFTLLMLFTFVFGVGWATTEKDGAKGGWHLVTDNNELKAGEYEYIMVPDTPYMLTKVAGPYENGHFTALPFEGNVVICAPDDNNNPTVNVISNDVKRFTLEAVQGSNYYLKDSDGNYYHPDANGNIVNSKEIVHGSFSPSTGEVNIWYNWEYKTGYNPDDSSFQSYYKSTDCCRIRMFYRRIPKTLAEIEAEDASNTFYTISDELLVVKCLINGNVAVLLCKDDGPSHEATDMSTIPADCEDFMTVHAGFNGDWDQSNWIMLSLSNLSEEDLEKVQAFEGMRLAANSITFYNLYDNGVNFIARVGINDLVMAEGSQYTTYSPNLYCPANFYTQNLYGQATGYELGAEPTPTDEHFFFMNPKYQEVCEITNAVWNLYDDSEWNEGGYFMIPLFDEINNPANIPGAVSVNWDLNNAPVEDPETGEPEGLEEGVMYKFKAVVFGPWGEYLKGNESKLEDYCTPQYGHYYICPFDFDPKDKEYIVTSIKDVVDVTDKTVDGVKYYNLAGIESDRPFEGVNIIVTTYTDGSRSSSKVLK